MVEATDFANRDDLAEFRPLNQTLAPDGADEPLREGVLPRAVRGDAGDVAMRAGLRPTAKAVDLPPDSNAGAPAFYPTGVPRQSSTRPLRT